MVNWKLLFFIDTDECLLIAHLCGVGECHNYQGYYTCTCPSGYRFENHTCQGTLLSFFTFSYILINDTCALGFKLEQTLKSATKKKIDVDLTVSV